MSVTYVKEGELEDKKKSTMILGLPGVGKTRLAGTWPNPFFIDVDKGAASAHRGHVNRVEVDLDRGTRKSVIQILKKLNKQEAENGVIHYDVAEGPTLEIGTVVIDTLDAIQKACKTFEILGGKSNMSWDDYGRLLELMTELMLEWNNLPCHIVVCGHTKQREEEGERYGIATIKLAGSLRDEVPDWFDVILHVQAGQDGRRFVMSQPLVSRGVRYLAKDRHGLLTGLSNEKGFIELEDAGDGYPSSKIADAICGKGE